MIYSTHSPFLVDPANIDRAKVVYSDNNGMTVVSSDLRASDDKLNEKSIYSVHAALGLSVSDILLHGCQPIIVEGPSDQHYFNAIKLYLIRNKKYAPNLELVFMPSGGVRGISGVVSIVGGRDGELPFVILDADGSGKGANDKLKSGLYQHDKEAIVDIGEFLDFDNGEVEDLIPASIIIRQIARFFRDVDGEGFEDIHIKGQAIVPQIEAFASRHRIELDKGWKVDLAKWIKQQLIRAKADDVTEDYITKWEAIFNKFNR